MCGYTHVCKIKHGKETLYYSRERRSECCPSSYREPREDNFLMLGVWRAYCIPHSGFSAYKTLLGSPERCRTESKCSPSCLSSALPSAISLNAFRVRTILLSAGLLNIPRPLVNALRRYKYTTLALPDILDDDVDTKNEEIRFGEGRQRTNEE